VEIEQSSTRLRKIKLNQHFNMHSRVEGDELFELTATLVTASANLNKFLVKRGLPGPSFKNSPPSIALSTENAPYFDSKQTIIEAAEQIIRLVRGPRDILLDLSFQVGSVLWIAILLD
jgi:hypothetical protein